MDRTSLKIERLTRKIEKRDKRITGLERRIQQLENALSWRTIDLESLSQNLRREVQRALCDMRMIPINPKSSKE